jgi:hypothetical protein
MQFNAAVGGVRPCSVGEFGVPMEQDFERRAGLSVLVFFPRQTRGSFMETLFGKRRGGSI